VKRHFLFLQGVASPFFSRLGDWLLARGERVTRVNFCAGDALYWRGKPAWAYRGGVRQFAAWLEPRLAAHGVTDIVLFGDQRPMHREAVAAAKRHGLRVHAFEEGYVRPNWITLERGGNNAASPLPRDPAWYRAAARLLPPAEMGAVLLPSLRARAGHDMAYHAANVVNPLLYPGYRTHRPRLSALEYAGWAARYSRYPFWLQRDRRRIAGIANGTAPYYFFPLQLNGDVQVAVNSPFGNIARSIEHVLRSFAAHALRETLLVIKNHPFDTGLVDYRRLIRRLEDELDIRGRVVYLETGHLPTLLGRAAGVVTVNSTAGLQALHHQRPTKTLGRAVYDLAGMTAQTSLDNFWGALPGPDAELVAAFTSVVIHAAQVTGGFYSAQGIATTLAGCERLLEPASRLERLLERCPAPPPCATPAAS
jgi:capsular polysaccharide export protein